MSRKFFTTTAELLPHSLLFVDFLYDENGDEVKDIVVSKGDIIELIGVYPDREHRMFVVEWAEKVKGGLMLYPVLEDYPQFSLLNNNVYFRGSADDYIETRTHELSTRYGEYMDRGDIYNAARMIEAMNEINRMPRNRIMP